MSKLIVNLPAIRKSIRNLKSAAAGLQGEKKVTSAERTRKYRERLKNDSAKLEKLKQVKKEQNHKYKEHIKQERQNNTALDEQLKAKQREWKRKSRKRKSAKAQRESAKKVPESNIPKSNKKLKQSSIRKNAERVRKHLPTSPTRWVKTIKHILKNATPRKQMQMMSTVSKETELDTSNIEEILDIQRAGRPSKKNEQVKRKLAFASSKGSRKKRWNNTRYRKRKQEQEKRRMTKPNAYKARWQEPLISFLENHSRIMPNKKDTLLIQGKPVAKRHLLCSKRELYRMFKKENQGFSRKLTTFLSMIPKNYKCLNLACRRVCVCGKDYNLEQQVNALNKKAQEKSMKDLTKCTPRELSNLSVCPFDKIPARACVDRKCENCGVATVQNLYSPLLECCSELETVRFSQWEKITETYTTRKGELKTTTRWIQSEKNEKVEEVVDSVAEKIDTFTAHMFRADYQHRIETEIISTLPIDHCLVVMDFSENMSLQPQDEIESSHWTHKQVTLHPVYIVRHATNSTEESPVIVKESLIILSDHLTHDADAVFAFTEQLLIHLQNTPVKVLHRYSDNCATQYKCRFAFEHLLVLEEKYNIQVVYHYTESGHGKGPSDGLGAGIKKRIERLILGGKLINNAYQAYLALVQTETEKKNQHIIYVPSKRIKASTPQKRPSKTIPGTQSFHTVRQWRPNTGMLMCADLSCSCQVCVTAEEGPCFFAQYRQPDQFFSLKDGKKVPRENLTIYSSPASASMRILNMNSYSVCMLYKKYMIIKNI